MSGQATTIRVPRWIQLVGLPVLALLAFLVAGRLGHVLFLFLTASVIAFMLNPLVRDLTRLKVPRGLGVLVVYVLFAAAAIAGLVLLTTIVVDQVRTAADRVDTYLTDEGTRGNTGAQEDIDRLQA